MTATQPGAPWVPTGSDTDLDRLLDGYYWCGRVWEAWQYNTMGEDDFEPAGECALPAELIAWRDAAVAAERERITPLLSAYHRLYDLWQNKTGTVEIDLPGYNGISYGETIALDDAAGAVEEILAGSQDVPSARPPIVVLCGSTRFVDEFNRQRKALTEAGEIVLSIEVVTTQSREDDPQHCDPELKARLDELHKRKIDLADYVLVLNVGGYLGESTRSEIAYALEHGKPVTYLEPVGEDAPHA